MPNRGEDNTNPNFPLLFSRLPSVIKIEKPQKHIKEEIALKNKRIAHICKVLKYSPKDYIGSV